MADLVGQQLGNYRLLRQLGSGAFASVYLGEHLYLERPAAVKILYVQMEPKTREGFLSEARIIARLDHPHIVRVLDFGIEKQIPYLVMEYIPNGTLRTRHPRGTRLSCEQIVSYVKQIASALDYAHEHHVIHCDVKPENMLLNAKGDIVLSDFGIAVVQRTVDTLSGDTLSGQNIAGTPLYMAPEQIMHHPCPASDQYAVAVMVYEWLCGNPPFPGPGLAVFGQHLYQEPPGLCARVPGLPPAVEDTVCGALAKEASHRFNSVQDFAWVLEEAFFSTHLLTKPEARIAEPQPTPSDTLPLPKVGTLRYTPSQKRPFSVVAPLSVAQQNRQISLHDGALTYPPGGAPLSISQRNRQILLRKVRSFWIEGVLNHSLHGATLLALGLTKQPDAVANPWQLVFQQPETTPRPLTAGTHIIQAYDEAVGELLILGAPGAGKTTLLLELARDLLERAESDEQHPMPVVFNLSSWAIEQPSLVEWLANELNSRYQVPLKIARALVEADQILPLLDGLDEVDVRVRTACIDAINTYRSGHGLQSLVVCSRSADYLERTERVRLGSAVMVQPLTPQQVMSYLSTVGPQVGALRAALQRDADLQALATTPLMLNILILAYQGIPLDQIAPLGTLPAKQQQIFATYVQRMLTSRSASTHYTPEQVLPWLSFLAQKMKQRNQSIFYIESIQPDWLVDERMLRRYNWLAVRLPGVLVGVLVSLALPFVSLDPSSHLEVILLSGLLGWLLSGENIVRRPFIGKDEKAKNMLWSRLLQQLGVAALLGLSVGLSLGSELVSGWFIMLGFGVCCFLLMVFLRNSRAVEVSSAPYLSEEMRPRRPLKRTAVSNGLLVGLLFGLNSALRASSGGSMSHKLFFMLAFAVISGLIGGLLSALLVGRGPAVQLTDRLVWTWKSLGKSLFSKQLVRLALQFAALSGLLVGLIGLVGGMLSGLFFGLSFGLVIGLSCWLLLGVFQGVASKTIEDQHRVIPNQGIRHSALNGLIFGLGIAILVGVSSGLVFEGNSLLETVSTGLVTGLSVGLLAGLYRGGLACLRHYVLRILLWRSGLAPWNYLRFLDTATEHILLRKVGGGYIFLHRLLLEYFAAQRNKPSIK